MADMSVTGAPLSAIGAGRDEVLAAQDILMPEMARRPAASLDFVGSILAALAQTFDRADNHLPAAGDTRALVIARRIVAWKKPSDQVRKGEHIGMIRFGSRTDLYVPSTCTVHVTVGQRVKGGETILASWPK